MCFPRNQYCHLEHFSFKRHHKWTHAAPPSSYHRRLGSSWGLTNDAVMSRSWPLGRSDRARSAPIIANKGNDSSESCSFYLCTSIFSNSDRKLSFFISGDAFICHKDWLPTCPAGKCTHSLFKGVVLACTCW